MHSADKRANDNDESRGRSKVNTFFPPFARRFRLGPPGRPGSLPPGTGTRAAMQRVEDGSTLFAQREDSALPFDLERHSRSGNRQDGRPVHAVPRIHCLVVHNCG